MVQRAWYLTLESAKRQVLIDDQLDDETYKRAIQAASDAMPRQFFVQTATHDVTAQDHHTLRLNGLDLLSVTSLATDPSGDRSYSMVWNANEYELGPEENPYLTPPRPYWRITRAPTAHSRYFPTHIHHGIGPLSFYGGSGQRLMRGVRIVGRWGVYDVRKALPVVLVSPDEISEVQVLTPSGTISGGTFTLTYAGETTDALDWDSTAGEIQDALEALPTIGSGNIAGTGGPINTDPVTLTFQNDLASMDVAQITRHIVLTGTDPLITITTTVEGNDGLIGADDTTLNVSGSEVVETGHTLHVGDEDIFVEAVDGSTLTVTRGVNGSTAAAHDDGAAIEVYTYPLADQAVLFLVQRYVRRSKDAPFGMVSSIDGFMRLAINDPDVLGLIGRFMQPSVASAVGG